MELGRGSHRYELVDGWAKLPAGKKFGHTHGVVVDRDDNVYIFNQSDDALMVFDRDGHLIRSWGSQYSKGAHGLFLAKEDGQEVLWLVDYVLQKVAKTTMDGEELLTIDRPQREGLYEKPEQYKPTDVCVAPNGDVYVFDGYGQSWIHQYDSAGKYIRSFGGKGSEQGKLNCPHGGWVDTRRATPELYVADRGNHRIQVFTLEGQHVRFITDEMQMPCCFYQWHDELYIPDLNARVTIYDKHDKPVTVLGDYPEAMKTPGYPETQGKIPPDKFSAPHACCVDSRGDVYVVEWISTGRVSKLRRRQA
jgi:DNA-binding beta-propeller fold protein YncE